MTRDQDLHKSKIEVQYQKTQEKSCVKIQDQES